MNNKTIASLTLASFVIIFVAVFVGAEWQEFLYGAGALGTLIFGGLTLSRLYRADSHSKFPYIGGTIMFVFWLFAIIAPGGMQLLAIFYLAQGIYGAGKLYQTS
jgi:hypothetical protein